MQVYTITIVFTSFPVFSDFHPDCLSCEPDFSFGTWVLELLREF